MTNLDKNLYVLDGSEKKSGSKTLKGSEFPYLKYERDTWRLQSLFKEAVECYKSAGNETDKNFMQVIKKVWINFNISTNTERTRMKKLGFLNPDYVLTLATDTCKCCGRVMWYGRVHNMVEGYAQPSLDRMNNEHGYRDDNVWIICNNCNKKKNDSLSPNDLYRIAAEWEKESSLREKDYKQYCKEHITTLENINALT